MKILMKHLLVCVGVISASFFITSCNTNKFLAKTPDGKNIDVRLVGDWKGSETDNQVKGMTKKWHMTRTKDGKFTLDFKAILDEEVQQFIEQGNWWVKDGKFYEYHESSGKTDVYAYEVLDVDQVKFKAVSIGVQFENEAYEFIDTRVK